MKTNKEMWVAALTAVSWASFTYGAVEWPALVDRSADRVETPLNVPFKRVGTLRPRGASEIKASNWTLGCEGLDRDFDDFTKFRDYIEPLGIKTIRLQAGWYKTERTPGKLDFTWLDEIIDYAVAHGLNVLLETDYGNPAYGAGGGTHLLGADYPTSPEALAAWDHWVDELSKRYKGKVRDWAMWNEPDLACRFNTDGTRHKRTSEERHTPEQIAAQNVRTARIIKKNIPDARIGALSLAANNPVLLEKCLASMGKDVNLFEWVIYHGYARNPETSYPNVEAQRQVALKYNPNLKMRQGENGCPSAWVPTSALSQYPWSEYSQAKWDMRRMLGDLGHDVESAVFTIMGNGENKCLLRRDKQMNVVGIKMAYYAVQNVASVFDNTLTRVRHYSVRTNDVTISMFEYRKHGDRKKPLYVFWSNGNATSKNPLPPGDSFITRPVAFRMRATFTDPVWVDLLTGRVYAVPKKNVLPFDVDKGFYTYCMIPVYDSPCILTDKSNLDLIK